jgi:hypothetical protein
MLRIPGPDDQPQALVIPLPPRSGDGETGPERRKKRRKSGRGGNFDWDGEAVRRRGSSVQERRVMLWMLAGGTVLFIACVAVVFLAMHRRHAPVALVLPPTTAPAVQQAAPDRRPGGPSDMEFRAAAEPLAKAFLEADSVEALLPLVHNPAVSGPRIREFHQASPPQAAGMAAFDTRNEVARTGTMLTVWVRTGDLDERPMAFAATPEGLRIDWESWAGWSEMPWERFLAERPVTDKLFRVVLRPVDYYNFAFTDDRKWQSYRLESADAAHAVYGYTERGSVLDSRIRPAPDVKQVPLTLALRFPADAGNRNQVLIGKIIAEGWVVENENPPQ